MHVRAQVLKDIRPDGYSYSVSGKDTVGTRCKAAGQNGNKTVTVVNNVCMTDPSAFNFATLYAFSWRHEQCHLLLMRNKFPTIADPRTKLETIVRKDTAAFHSEAWIGMDGFLDAGFALQQAKGTIDTTNSQTYTLWSRDTTNTKWHNRNYQPQGILATGC
jgi:hypothetical protein